MSYETANALVTDFVVALIPVAVLGFGFTCYFAWRLIRGQA